MDAPPTNKPAAAVDRPGRNAYEAPNPLVKEAAKRALIDGGNAVDMVLAGVLTGATYGSESGLLGGGGILVVGPGVGQHFIDGRPRAPGLGTDRRPKTPDTVPDHWQIAVPGLLPAVIAAQARFGELSLMQLTRIAMSVISEEKPFGALKARLRFLDRVGRTGVDAYEREGVLRLMMDAAGPVVGGLLTEEDLKAVSAPIVEVLPCTDGEHEVFVGPRASARKTVQTPATLPEMAVESVVAADMRGVTAVASWCAPATAATLGETSGLGLGLYVPKAVKGVPRHRPGMVLPVPLPVSVIRSAGRAWAACGVTGGGAVVDARDAAVTERLAQGGVTLSLGDEPRGPAHGVAAWVVRDSVGDRVVTAVRGV